MEGNNSMNKMGTEPIKKLMFVTGMPMILSMILQALYNIVDSYFVSCIEGTASIPNMGEYAVNALTLAFPIQMLIIAVGVGTGVGVNALLPRSIGQGDRKKASCIAGNSIFIGICTYVVFLIFGLIGVNAYITSQTADSLIIEMGNSYLTICTTLSFGVILFMIYEKLLQGTGRSGLSTIAQVAGALTNIILDPILIFGYFGLPVMGIQGAAYATVIGQIVSCILGIVFHHNSNNKDMDCNLHYMKPRKHIIGEIYKIGIPAVIMQALMSFMTYGVNIIFGTVSSAMVTAYGVYYKIQQFVLFAAFGMNNAIIPIISFNYGKKDKDRINDSIKYGMIYTLIIMIIGFIFLQVFAYKIIDIFAISKGTQDLCVMDIRIITFGYLFIGANIAYQGIFQALGCGISSLVVSLLRQIIVVLPLAWVLTKYASNNVIWAAFPIAEACALLIAMILMKKIYNEKLYDIEHMEFNN